MKLVDTLDMVTRTGLAMLFVSICCGAGFALEPDEILIVANSDNAESVRIARYYCQQRKVPAENILTVALGAGLEDKISRNDYERWLAGPIRKKFFSLEFAGKIRCLIASKKVAYWPARRESTRYMLVTEGGAANPVVSRPPRGK